MKYVNPKFVHQIVPNTPKKVIITNSRSEIIKPEYVGTTIKIYNGIRFYELKINEKMIGYKFGEFSPTRRFPKHKKKK